MELTNTSSKLWGLVVTYITVLSFFDCFWLISFFVSFTTLAVGMVKHPRILESSAPVRIANLAI